MTYTDDPGRFYLGRLLDPEGGAAGEPSSNPLIYDAKDLTTHAVCVGMTGSGKTGLGISLLEEAALDGVPAIVIDPKGDMANLLLGFPELRPQDFEPWIDPDQAAREGLEPGAFAARTAERWREGLAKWDQDGERIRRMQERVELRLYTPGSTAGRPITVLRSLDAPAPALLEDREAFGDRIQGAVSGVLALLDIDADPLKSREAILLSNVLQLAWGEGRDLDIAELIRAIQDPPFEKLGVLDVESFFPKKDRFELAMALNNLLASPGFAPWMEGDPLDVGRLFRAPDGRPRVSILSIAHLSDSERMFFVTILLNEVVAWMRTQPGTSGLRALLYMDEIFGYFPPTKEPPSKKPMLTLLKQARAFGLGVVLATQNPVDLDYKGLSNAGTWFLGRLQTERDKARVLDGLEGAMTSGGRTFDRQALEKILSGLGKRTFLLNNVHEDQPLLFRTRWALSYLRGPLTRAQIRALSKGDPEEQGDEPSQQGDLSSDEAAELDAELERVEVAAEELPAAPSAPAPSFETGPRPSPPERVRERFLAPTQPGTGGLVYRPALLCEARLHFVHSRSDLDIWQELHVLASFGDDELSWEGARFEAQPLDLGPEPLPGVSFEALPRPAQRSRSYASWRKDLRDHLYRTREVGLWSCDAHKLYSKLGETRGDFHLRVRRAVDVGREQALEKLSSRFATKIARQEERIRTAEGRVETQEEQYQAAKGSSGASILGSILGFFGSRKSASGHARRASSAARSVGRISKEKGDVERAAEDLAARREALERLKAELEDERAELRAELSSDAIALEDVVVRPRKSDLDVEDPILVWTPWRVGADGSVSPA